MTDVAAPTPADSLTEVQRRLVIRASAGTGKTFQLTNRYIALLRNAAPDRILASTFTRKAAGEILERILLRLARAALDPKELAGLKEFVGTPPITRKECLKLLQDLTRQLHRVRISTLDGFFARLAGSFSLELGLPPGWRIMEELEAAQLRDHAIETFLRTGSPRDLLQMMHLLDKGSAKRSVHQLITDKIELFYDLFLNSSTESWERFPRIRFLSEEQQAAVIGQIEAFPLDDRRFASRRDADCALMREDRWGELGVNGFYCRIVRGELSYYRKPIPEGLCELYLQLRSHVQATLIAPLKDQTKATRRLLEEFHAAYEQFKDEARGLRFDDITRRLSDGLCDRKSSDLAFRLDGEIDHVLLDEFQDTSPSQWRVLRPFAEDACTRAAASFFCVGDAKQAIYGWRGGEAAIFETIEQQLEGLHPESLNRSYRSSPVIMRTANRIFAGIGRHDGLDELTQTLQHWSQEFPEHETARESLPGYVRFMTGPIPEGAEEEGHNSPTTANALWTYTAASVQQILRDAPGGTVGVLTRTNGGVNRLIYELNQLGIDASEEGGSPVTDSAAVELVLSLMTLADHPGDTISRFHLATSSLGEALGYTDFQDDARAHAFAHLLRARLAGEGYAPLVHELIKQLAPACNRRELRRLTQLASLADTFDASTLTLRPTRFVQFVRSQKVQEPTASQVRVMTVHQSKGLEFDSVVLAELDKLLTSPPSYVTRVPAPGEPPDLVSLSGSRADFEAMGGPLLEAYHQTTARGLCESLCLLYVAVTRAVHSLHILIRPSTAKNPSATLPKTYAGLLRAALAPESLLGSETLLYEEGEPRWFEKLPPGQEGPNGTRSRSHPLPLSSPPPPLFSSTSSGRRLERIAPSHKEAKRPLRLRQVLRQGNADALARGTLFHRWLEEVRWLDEGPPPDELLLRIGRELGSRHDLEECLGQFHAAIRTPSIASALSRSACAAGLSVSPAVKEEISSGPFQLELVNEQKFAMLEGERLINGSIDRLVLISRDSERIAADVVDYKTDLLPDDERVVRERIDHYREQISAYARAVAKIYRLPLSRISARLILLSLGQVEAVAVPESE